MRKKIVLLSPSTHISGGVKVIIRLAYLLGEAFDVSLVTDNYVQAGMEKMLPQGVNNRFKVVPKNPLSNWQGVVAESAVAINYADANPRIIPVQTKQILYFQGIVSEREIPNIQSFPYTAIVTVSPALTDIVKKNCNTPVYCIPPGVDSIFRPKVIPDKPPFAVGVLHHRSKLKNSMLAVAGANSYARKGYSTCSLYILSATNIPQDYIAKIAVPYKTFVNPHQNFIQDMYCSCAAWISTSRNEGLGLPVLEAMACGVPVLWLPNQGLKDCMVDGENCLFIENNPSSVAFALRKLHGNPALTRKIVSNGMKLAHRFTWENTIKKFTEIINQVTGP